MSRISIFLPESINEYIEKQVISRNLKSVDDYILELIQQDQSFGQDLEPLLLDGLDSGETTPMAPKDWEHIRQTVSVMVENDRSC